MNCWCNKIHNEKIQEIDVLIVSIGGVSTSNLANKLKNTVKLNRPSDKDHIKHINYDFNGDRLRLFKPKKIIYVVGDCINALYSLFRRGYHWYQIKKLTNGKNKLPNNIKTVKDYLNFCGTKDLFMFEEHFLSWYNQKEYPIIFINSRKIYQPFNIKKLCNFLNIGDINLGELKKRNSNWKEQPISDKNKLIKIYGKFNDFLLKLDPVIIRNQ